MGKSDHAGHCTVGNFGSEEMMMYTIVGGAVNTASRLQCHAEPGHILISFETHALVKDEIFCEKSKRIHLKGISEPVQTYNVVDLAENVHRSKKIIKKETEALSFKLDPSRMDPLQKKAITFFLEGVLDILKQDS